MSEKEFAVTDLMPPILGLDEPESHPHKIPMAGCAQCMEIMAQQRILGENLAEPLGAIGRQMESFTMDFSQYLLVDGSRAGATAQAQDFGTFGIKADLMTESTTDAGITAEGVSLKDNNVSAPGEIKAGPSALFNPTDTQMLGAAWNGTISVNRFWGSQIYINKTGVGNQTELRGSEVYIYYNSGSNATSLDAFFGRIDVRQNMVGTVRAGHFHAKQGFGTITGDMRAIYARVDQDGTISGNSVGVYIDCENNVDYGLYINGAPTANYVNNLTIGTLTGVLWGNNGLVEVNGALADPDADRIVFWDDSDSQLEYLTPGNGLAITVNTLDVIAHTHDGETLQIAGINSNDGAWAFDTTGAVAFNQIVQAPDFAKTGWPVTPGVTLSFDNANRRLTVTDGGAAYYYVEGVKYTLGGNKTVDITDTEGLWYFYFVGSTLTASQAVWDFTAEDKALVAFVYWDATNNEQITLGYELHNFRMDGSTHGRMHFGGGSAWDSGLLAWDAGAEDINVDAGIILDEDITIAITDGAGGALWEQVLSPAELPIYYRDGASAWRIYDTADKANATDAGYVDGANALHYNKLNGVWASTAAGVGKYVAYYVVATNDQTEPVALIMGQRTDTTLAAAKANNIFSGLSLSGLPFEEMVILARLLLKQTAGGLFYTLEDVSDLRSFNAQGNVTSPLITDHGGLGGLGDDDHLQYWIAGTVRGGNFATTGTLGIGTATPDRAVEILDAANPQLRLTQADAARYVDFQVDSGASLIITSIANQIMKLDVTPLHNIAIGKDAGTNFTTGSFNVAVGRGTMLADTEGSNNTAVGALCFITNTTGYQNCALGVSALYGNTTGYSNVGLGVSALYTNTIGYNNTSGGVGSSYFNTEGHSNVALGFEALRGNTTASNNTAVGGNASRSTTTGAVNAAFGLNSLYANITGSYNVGIGVNALRFNTAGSTNVALGYAAGYYETGSSKLFIDNATRTNEADGRVKALVYGIFAAATADQYFTINGSFDVLENVALHGYVDLDEIAAPGNPAANVGRIYVRDNAGTTTPYFLDSAGVETSMIAAGGLVPHKDTHDPEDGADPLDTAAAGAIQPDDASATGTSHSFARADHVHQIDCDTPNAIVGVQAGAEGTATYFARSDHDHAISHSIADNALVTMDDAGPAAASEYARFTASGLEGRTAAELLSDIGGGGFTWIQKAAAYTASDMDGILLDSTGGAFTITLPLNPVGGEAIAFVDAGSAGGTNNITIARNGENIQGNAGDLVIDFDDASFVLVFDATYGWRLDPYFATGSPTFLSDADGDTLVQVEQGADDDTIRFTAGGVAVATMVATAIEFGQNVGIGVTPAAGHELDVLTTYVAGDAIAIYGKAATSNANDNYGVYGYATNAGAGTPYPFYDNYGNHSDGGGWVDISLSGRKTDIRSLVKDDIDSLVGDVEAVDFKKYRMREFLSIDEETMEPELGGAIGPELLGLIADDEATPASLVSLNREGVSGSRLAITALVYAREKIKTLEARVAYLEQN